MEQMAEMVVRGVFQLLQRGQAPITVAVAAEETLAAAVKVA
jgi:hypothetical protein